MTSYTVSSFDEVAYTVVQVTTEAPGLSLPDPAQVPQVAQDTIPERHRGPVSPGGDYQIVTRRVDESDPLDVHADWIDIDAVREHKRKNPDVWEGE